MLTIIELTICKSKFLCSTLGPDICFTHLKKNKFRMIKYSLNLVICVKLINIMFLPLFNCIFVSCGSFWRSLLYMIHRSKNMIDHTFLLKGFLKKLLPVISLDGLIDKVWPCSPSRFITENHFNSNFNIRYKIKGIVFVQICCIFGDAHCN